MDKADLSILNTCAVTQKAAMQSRQAIRRAIRSNPEARILVTGCYAQLEPEVIKQINGVHSVISHADKNNIPDIVNVATVRSASCQKPAGRDTCKLEFKPVPEAGTDGRTRPFLKIQDGCDAFCTYCIVPYARGRSRSIPLEDVMKNITRIAGAGYHEVVLCGVHLGVYGLDLSSHINLTGLLKHIAATAPIDRVRISSIEPHELSDEIIHLMAGSNHICHHLHIPLQSGDDLILKRMRRPYSRSFFKKLICKVHGLIPDAAIGVDVLVGFPGETQAAFENTYRLIEKLPVSYLHVFPFSARKGTPASDYPQKVLPRVIKSRCRLMHQLGGVKKKNFYGKFVGQTLPLLLESKRNPSGLLKGMTSNYLPVFVTAQDDLKNTMARARIETITDDNQIIGTIC